MGLQECTRLANLGNRINQKRAKEVRVGGGQPPPLALGLPPCPYNPYALGGAKKKKKKPPQKKKKKKQGLRNGYIRDLICCWRGAVDPDRPDGSIQPFPIASLVWWCCSDPTLSPLQPFLLLSTNFHAHSIFKRVSSAELLSPKPPFFPCPSKEYAVINARSLIHIHISIHACNACRHT